MDARNKKAWMLVTGVLALFSAIFLPGCIYIGTQTVAQTNPDTFSGYYEMAPTSLSVCATVEAQPPSPSPSSSPSPTPSPTPDASNPTQCASVNTNQIPNSVAQYLTDPVAFIVADLSSGSAGMTSPANASTATSAFPMNFSTATGELGLLGEWNSDVFISTLDCTLSTYVEAQGQLNQSATNFTTGFNGPLHGRITLDLEFTQTFQGNDCPAALQAVSNCYFGISDCSKNTDITNLLTQLEMYFQAGVLDDTKISNLQNFSYEVIYQ